MSFERYKIKFKYWQKKKIKKTGNVIDLGKKVDPVLKMSFYSLKNLFVS